MDKSCSPVKKFKEYLDEKDELEQIQIKRMFDRNNERKESINSKISYKSEINNINDSLNKISIFNSVTNDSLNNNITKLEKSESKENNKDEIVISNFKVFLNKRLGGGSFGEIFKGLNTKTNESIAIKIEPSNTIVPQLNHEFKIIKYLNDNNDGIGFVLGIPKAYYFCSIGNYNFLMMEELSSSIEDLFKDLNKKVIEHNNKYKQEKIESLNDMNIGNIKLSYQGFSLKTIIMIADQMISRIEYLHSKNLVHRDIKPENFLITKEKKKKHLIYLIDYGMTKRYRDKDNNHIPYAEGKEFLGTVKFSSVYTHLGIEQSRRDDLESIGYVLVYLATGTLPWLTIENKNKKVKYNLIMESKRDTKYQELCGNLPKQFIEYFKYIRLLQFDETPDYSYLKDLMKSVAKENNIIIDYEYDWEVKNTDKGTKESLMKNLFGNNKHLTSNINNVSLSDSNKETSRNLFNTKTNSISSNQIFNTNINKNNINEITELAGKTISNLNSENKEIIINKTSHSSNEIVGYNESKSKLNVNKDPLNNKINKIVFGNNKYIVNK